MQSAICQYIYIFTLNKKNKNMYIYVNIHERNVTKIYFGNFTKWILYIYICV